MITKTISKVVEQELIPLCSISFDMLNKKCCRGFNFDGKDISGYCDIESVASLLSTEEKGAVRKFFRMVTAMCANDAISPDTNLQDSDINNDF